MKTLQEQYKLIKEGKGHKGVFLTEAKSKFPNLIRNSATFEEATSILKSKEVINENFVGLQAVGNYTARKEPWADKFASFLIEEKEKETKAKAEEKKTTKEVEELETRGYDYKDKKSRDNVFGEEFLKGFYAEMKDPKNSDKTEEQLKEIVTKNLTKDPLHYVADGQFGVKGLGYSVDHPGLGETKEAKGKYKASGYGDLKESLSLTSLILDEAEYYMPQSKETKKKEEPKKKKAKKSLVSDKVKEIESAGNVAALEAKMGAIEEEIENREMKMKMATENEDLSEFINPTKIKEMEKEVKELQKSKERYLKEYKRLTGEEYGGKKEIVDEEVEEITEGTPGGVAYMRGQKDYDNGASEDENPYEKTDEPYSDYEEWYEGWFYSKMEDELHGAR